MSDENKEAERRRFFKDLIEMDFSKEVNIDKMVKMKFELSEEEEKILVTPMSILKIMKM